MKPGITRFLGLLLLVSLALTPAPCASRYAQPRRTSEVKDLISYRVAIRSGDQSAPLRLVEQLLGMEYEGSLDGALAEEWIKAGRLFGREGHSDAAAIVFRWVEGRAREGPWRARAAIEALELRSRTTGEVAGLDWVALAVALPVPVDLQERVGAKCVRGEASWTQDALIDCLKRRRTSGYGLSMTRLRVDLKDALSPAVGMQQ